MENVESLSLLRLYQYGISFKSKPDYLFRFLPVPSFVWSLISQDSALQASNEQEVKGRDPAVWHVGLKVAWDIETPGLAVPLHQGDIYLMLGNFQGLRSWNFLLKIERIRLTLKKVIISSLQLGLFLFRKT